MSHCWNQSEWTEWVYNQSLIESYTAAFVYGTNGGIAISTVLALTSTADCQRKTFQYSKLQYIKMGTVSMLLPLESKTAFKIIPHRYYKYFISLKNCGAQVEVQ